MFILRKRYAAAAVAAAFVVGGVAAVRSQAAPEPAATAAEQAVAVDVATVSSRQITDWHDYSGRLEAVDRVEIRPLVSGTLMQVHFTDGALVQKGDVLFTIDRRPYQAAVDQARAQVAATQARAAYTATELARGKRLLASNAIAKRDYDEKRNAAREAAANLQAAQAMLTSAELDLEHTRIVAPIAGRVSRAEVTVGNVVAAGAGSAPLTTLVSVARMYASFDVDEQSFLKFVHPARAAGGAPVSVSLGLASEAGYPRLGELASVDNRLDTSSGTIRVRAVFDNADGALVPGLYARIRLGGGTPHEAVLIDEKAIGTDQNKRFVVVVDDSNTTAYREVSLGANREGYRVIESGLRNGERIVINGLQRIRPGEPITPRSVPAPETPKLAAAGAAPVPGPDDNS
ncbi:efflux RND transporter periplasmic adaptor subunit [Pusillimonas sp. SM2304]|uniref:efflux RND transporter periplasmic adaptor subunit n=1 Tax=Pusillimonas sp. SM2304 TaxID=3073241 RepID=UPI002875675C|nr:efflux RND transporter periplasmic adaptor subunit [Pusillimonas sp. SM2304]MDS1141622.1 efflux RND transporter periplasmic adaptor subunit [Pusillimonas sp. SM2304]